MQLFKSRRGRNKFNAFYVELVLKLHKSSHIKYYNTVPITESMVEVLRQITLLFNKLNN